jgi:hypothetical protein
MLRELIGSVGFDVDVTGSWLLPMSEFDINSVEPWSYAT